MIYNVKIEQTWHETKRMKYIAVTDSYIEKDCTSLSADRFVKEPYGWIMESGTPPCEHLDALVMTDKDMRLGETISVRVIGVFKRNDNDHKLVTVPLERTEQDFYELPENEKQDMFRLYPIAFEGEGWFGRDVAEGIVEEFFCRKKRKRIIMVQHTQSEHHINGHAGGGFDWNLTELGRQQAFEIGKYLEREIKDKDFCMYVSCQARAKQTAEEMNKTLGLPMEIREEIREVSAGEGNGKPWDWFQAHKKPEDGFDPDYRPFEDADSDRDLWKRIYPFYQEIISNDKENILIVSHGCSLGFLQTMLMGYRFEDRRKSRIIGPSGGISKFSVDIYGRVTAECINQRLNP